MFSGAIQLFIQNFAAMHINDIVDIAAVTFLLFQFIRLIRETSTSQILRGVLVLLAAMIVSDVLDLVMLSTLFHAVFTWGIIVLAIIFQPELRRALRRVGESGFASIFFSRENEITVEEAVVHEMVKACKEMSWTRTGALVIFERRDSLREIIKTGTTVDAKVVDELIRTIFYEGTPRHDGAMIIRGGRICAAGCVLPLSDNRNIAKELGTRHRAAVGMSERADSISLVVSEETGAISVVTGGHLQRNLIPEQLEEFLTDMLVPKEEDVRKVTGVKLLLRKLLGIRGERS